MKYFLLFFAATLIVLTAFTPKNATVLKGKVTDDAGEALIGASVKVLKGTEFVRGAVTDYNGEYRVPVDPGIYNVEVSYPGFKTARTTGVRVIVNTINTCDVKMESGTVLSEVVVTDYKIPIIEQDVLQSGQTLTSDQIKNLPTRKANAIVTNTAGAPSTDGGDVKVKGARKEAAKMHVDGIRVSHEPHEPVPAMDIPLPKTATADIMADDESVREAAPGGPAHPAPRAGLLTAGEWNDLHNWNTHWLDLQTDGETDAYQEMYGFYPKQRYALLLQNEQELPVTDAAVQLIDAKGATVWEARTDNLGRAELWNGLYGQPATGKLSLRVWLEGQKYELGAARPFPEGLNRHKIKRECRHSSQVDLVWTVDATGSMGDELEYLKTELLDVIGRVKAANPDLSVRVGSVFYRDKGDSYLVKSSPLDRDVAKTVEYIRQQSAAGGGDYPEAVHSALEETVNNQPWSPDAVARICFLLLDASPHQRPEVRDSLQRSIREAAKKGIRVVPVTASGIRKDTEFLMKFFGLATNGSYVFLTDHSGIGGKHLEPTTDEYKVELLNDLLVRLITEYSTVPDCQGKSTIRFEDRQTPTSPAPGAIVYYPNPASQHFTLELSFDADKVTLYNAEGRAVRSLAQVQAGIHVIAVNDLNEGFYTLRVWKGAQVQSGKVVVVRA